MGASKKKILIVDDNSADCFLMEQHLKTAGLEDLTFVGTGEKAIEIVKTNSFDIASDDCLAKTVDYNCLIGSLNKLG